MLLFVGLGNPGIKYVNNRHNIGFMTVDEIILRHNFPAPKMKFNGALYEGKIGSQKIFILKPLTFMNLSGQSVSEAMNFYKVKIEDIIVFHDELDLSPSKLRVKISGGHAGHNGLRSIHQHIGSDYTRVRMGIGHPGHKDRVANYVLNDFSKSDADWLNDLIFGISDGASHLAKGCLLYTSPSPRD